jgi:hypothetical protein
MKGLAIAPRGNGCFEECCVRSSKFVCSDNSWHYSLFRDSIVRMRAEFLTARELRNRRSILPSYGGAGLFQHGRFSISDFCPVSAPLGKLFFREAAS